MFFLNAIRRLVLFSSSVFVLAGSPSVLAQEVLRVLAWDGYADPEIVASFEKRTGVSVEVTYTDSDDDLWEKLNNDGGKYDVFAVNTAELQRYIDLGLSIPINMINISNHAQQLPRFQDYSKITGIIRDGKTYAVPYTYSEMGLIYNRKLVKTPPLSIAAMWAPKYRGRVLAFNTSNHNFTLAGMLMGVDNPFKMSTVELDEATKLLIKLRRNVLTFYTMADEATQWFTQYDIALVFANYGTQQVKALRDAGADIGYVIPQEGALAWLDCWAISNAAKNRLLAESWINYMLEKSVSERLTSAHGLANTITPFPESKPGDKILWLEPLENPALRKALWDKILSGQPLEAF
jgi:putative spermidine/putrescine transport system substrate-binding protein